MKPIDKFNDYLKDQNTSMESDDITKEIISDFYKEELLRDRWKKILKEKHNYGESENTATPKVDNKKNGKRILLITALAVAASILLFFYVNIGNTVNQLGPVDQLLSAHYEKPFPRDVLKGPRSTLALRSEAYAAYQNKDYATTISSLEQLVAEGGVDQEDYFYLGLSYLYNKQPDQSARQFKTLLDRPTSNYQDIATWYLGLALTDAKKYDEAKVYLSKVATWNGNKGKQEMAEDAMDLMKVIDERKAE